MPLKPCKHCGLNFMSTEATPYSQTLCNNCQLRQPTQKNQEKKMQDEVKILINFPRKYQIEIEEICMNRGINFSDYFLDLYESVINGDPIRKKSRAVDPDDLPKDFGQLKEEEESDSDLREEVKEFNKRFEEIGHHGKKKHRK